MRIDRNSEKHNIIADVCHSLFNILDGMDLGGHRWYFYNEVLSYWRWDAKERPRETDSDSK